MAWTPVSPNGNFSLPNVTSSQLWMPVHPDYPQINVERRADMVKIVSDLVHFRLDHLYSDNLGTATTTKTTGNGQLVATGSQLHPTPQSVQPFNYLFHYIDPSVVVLEQYFDRLDGLNPPGAFTRSRYVLFVNLGNETVVKDFSDKFHFSLTQLATNVNRTSEFLIMKALRLDPGEAMIATVEWTRPDQPPHQLSWLITLTKSALLFFFLFFFLDSYSNWMYLLLIFLFCKYDETNKKMFIWCL